MDFIEALEKRNIIQKKLPEIIENHRLFLEKKAENVLNLGL